MCTKRITKVISLSFILLSSMVSCDNYLTVEPLNTAKYNDYFNDEQSAVSAINACYAPLQWEFNSCYYNEWLIGDCASDDALLGGARPGSDPGLEAAFQIHNNKIMPNNQLLLQFYRTQYQGIFRCNVALANIETMDDSKINSALKKRLIGEALFLRSLYNFRLVRLFGDIVWVDRILDPAKDTQMPRTSREVVFDYIERDLTKAADSLLLKEQYGVEDVGRATVGAAVALAMRVKLFRAGVTPSVAAAKYKEVIRLYEDKMPKNYSLCPNYFDNFTLAGENGIESVFEIQYGYDPTSDGWQNGSSRGTFTVIMTGRFEGWRINRPSNNLYNAYEANDPRRDLTIDRSTDESDDWVGSKMFALKYRQSEKKLEQAARGEINNKVIRYSDVLLMYAEAACEDNQLDEAKMALNRVRGRVELSEFPYGSYLMNQSDLRTAIRHERRVELALEGHRYFDLLRWGTIASVINNFIVSESAFGANAEKKLSSYMEQIPTSRPLLMPIPQVERDVNKALSQNPGY